MEMHKLNVWLFSIIVMKLNVKRKLTYHWCSKDLNAYTMFIAIFRTPSNTQSIADFEFLRQTFLKHEIQKIRWLIYLVNILLLFFFFYSCYKYLNSRFKPRLLQFTPTAWSKCVQAERPTLCVHNLILLYNVQSGTKSKTNCIDKAQEYYLHELDK